MFLANSEEIDHDETGRLPEFVAISSKELVDMVNDADGRTMSMMMQVRRSASGDGESVKPITRPLKTIYYDGGSVF